ncbi:MAG: Ig domain-containing protein [Candidatus Binatales bacterium]
MKKTPKIHPHAIDLLARYFNSHKKGLPEWLKNAREAYLRTPGAPADRYIAINYSKGKKGTPAYLECIDFVGISGADIESRFLEWANPEAAAVGLKPEEREGGQGNGGKAYLRQLFETGYFISICNAKLSIVSFVDKEKFVLDFVPEGAGRDLTGDSKALPGTRKYCREWLQAFHYTPDVNITIVRGVSPIRPVDPDRLMIEIQQFPQARQTILACKVQYFENGSYKRDLSVREPERHPAFPAPIKIAVPTSLDLDGKTVPTARPPDYPQGELEISLASAPLQGQALSSWNRIDFRAGGLTVVGYKPAEELPLKFPQFANQLFGVCRVPFLTDPKENYEAQGRGPLIDGPLSLALYRFIAAEADKLLERLAKQTQSNAAQKKKKNLEKLNDKLAQWIEEKMPSLGGLSLEGDEGSGKKRRKQREIKEHEPPVLLKIHRDKLHICKGVTYELRAIGYDSNDRPVPPGKLVWTSTNPAVASIHPEKGMLEAKAPGIATASVKNADGLVSTPVAIQVHEAAEIEIKTLGPAQVGSNRRLPLAITVKTTAVQTVKDPIVAWVSSDNRVVTVGQDGTLTGGEVGEAEVVAKAGEVTSAPLEVEVIKGHAGKPKGGGTGKPRIFLSGEDLCPFDNSLVLLNPSDPLVYQRAWKPDYENNVFWINLQHLLADTLLKAGAETVQWRTYHFQRVVDVYMTCSFDSGSGMIRAWTSTWCSTRCSPSSRRFTHRRRKTPRFLIFSLASRSILLIFRGASHARSHEGRKTPYSRSAA